MFDSESETDDDFERCVDADEKDYYHSDRDDESEVNCIVMLIYLFEQ